MIQQWKEQFSEADKFRVTVPFSGMPSGMEREIVL